MTQHKLLNVRHLIFHLLKLYVTMQKSSTGVTVKGFSILFIIFRNFYICLELYNSIIYLAFSFIAHKLINFMYLKNKHLKKEKEMIMIYYSTQIKMRKDALW